MDALRGANARVNAPVHGGRDMSAIFSGSGHLGMITLYYVNNLSVLVLQNYTKIISITLTQDDFLLKLPPLESIHVVVLFIKPIRHFATLLPPFVDLLEADRVHEVFEMIKRQITRVFDAWKGKLD